MEERSGIRTEWECLLAAERRLQSIVPGTVLVGGTAAALHAGHRLSMDGDHILPDLRDRFDAVLTVLEQSGGWKTERVQRPVLILGELDGILTGVRQLRRERPLEVEVISGLRVPTLPEAARIKSWLLITRNTTRDYLDAVVLTEKLGESGLPGAFSSFDAIYVRGPRGGSPLLDLIECLGEARPADQSSVDLASYKGVTSPWNEWDHVSARGRFWASCLSAFVMKDE